MQFVQRVRRFLVHDEEDFDARLVYVKANPFDIDVVRMLLHKFMVGFGIPVVQAADFLTFLRDDGAVSSVGITDDKRGLPLDTFLNDLTPVPLSFQMRRTSPLETGVVGILPAESCAACTACSSCFCSVCSIYRHHLPIHIHITQLSYHKILMQSM